MIGFREAVAVSFLVLAIIREFLFKSQIPVSVGFPGGST